MNKHFISLIAIFLFAIGVMAQDVKSTTDYVYSPTGFEFKSGFYEKCKGLFSTDGKVLVKATKGHDGYISNTKFYVPYGTEVIAAKAFYFMDRVAIYIPTTVKYIAPDIYENDCASSDYRNWIAGISNDGILSNSAAVREICVDNHSEVEEVARYNTKGIKINESTNGIQIIQYNNGSSKKVLK